MSVANYGNHRTSCAGEWTVISWIPSSAQDNLVQNLEVCVAIVVLTYPGSTLNVVTPVPESAQPVSQSVTLSQSVSQSVIRSVSQSVSQSVIWLCESTQSVSQSLDVKVR